MRERERKNRKRERVRERERERENHSRLAYKGGCLLELANYDCLKGLAELKLT